MDMPPLRWDPLNTVRSDANWRTVTWQTHRAKVPGGWLVAVRASGDAPHGLVFYPDPEHRWSGGSIP
jgi:hypothetical protein